MFYPVYYTIRVDIEAESLEEAIEISQKCRFDNVRKSVDHMVVGFESLGINKEQMKRLYGDKYKPFTLSFFDNKDTRWVCVDGCGGIELELTDDIVYGCYHQGECDGDVEDAITIPEIRAQFDRISDEQLIRSLKECGIDGYDPETATRAQNERWALWMACGNADDDDVFNLRG